MLNQSIASGRQRLKKSYVGNNALKKSLIGGALKKSVVGGVGGIVAEAQEPYPDLAQKFNKEMFHTWPESRLGSIYQHIEKTDKNPRIKSI
jgi:hypothetical protein